MKWNENESKHTLLCQIPGLVDQWVYSGRAGDIIMRSQQAESDNIRHKNQIQEVRQFPTSGTGDPMSETKFLLLGTSSPCWGPL